MAADREASPDDIAALKEALAVERARSLEIAAELAVARANGVDPQAWLADVLARIAAQPAHRLDELLPWNWNAHVRFVAPPQAA
jgi:transposase